MGVPLRRFFLVLALVFLIGLLVVASLLRTPLPLQTEQQDITLQPGRSLTQFATALHEQGLLPHPRLLALWAMLSGQSRQLKAGAYRLQKGMTPLRLLDMIVDGRIILERTILVEGWTFAQWMQTLAATPWLTHSLSDKTPSQIMTAIGHPGAHPEGLFFPDTYFFPRQADEREVLMAAYDAMQGQLQAEWRKRASGLWYTTPYQALIAASLIEKEARLPAERPIIAGIILKRIKAKIAVQIDASVIYGLGDRYTGRLTRRQMRRATPYNIYLKRGLPPTPIAAPSLNAIQAALHPIATPYLYYVAKKDGSHYFSRTLAEHQAAIRRYLKGS